MKRKELYNYIKEEIVGALSETTYAGKGAVEKIKKDPKFNTLDAGAKTNTINDLNKGSDVELEEMARKAGGYKVGDTTKFAEAKDIYNKGLYAELLKFIEEAGEEGITQKELGIKLNKGDGSALNAILNKFKTVGVLGGGKIARAEKPETEEPETEEPDTSEVDDFFKADDEDETPVEKPKAISDKELEKTIGKSSSDLTPEEEKLFTTYKTAIINKIKVLSDKKASAEDKSKAQAAISNYKAKEDVKKVFTKKGLKLIDYINSELNK